MILAALALYTWTGSEFDLAAAERRHPPVALPNVFPHGIVSGPKTVVVVGWGTAAIDKRERPRLSGAMQSALAVARFERDTGIAHTEIIPVPYPEIKGLPAQFEKYLCIALGFSEVKAHDGRGILLRLNKRDKVDWIKEIEYPVGVIHGVRVASGEWGNEGCALVMAFGGRVRLVLLSRGGKIVRDETLTMVSGTPMVARAENRTLVGIVSPSKSELLDHMLLDKPLRSATAAFFSIADNGDIIKVFDGLICGGKFRPEEIGIVSHRLALVGAFGAGAGNEAGLVVTPITRNVMGSKSKDANHPREREGSCPVLSRRSSATVAMDVLHREVVVCMQGNGSMHVETWRSDVRGSKLVRIKGREVSLEEIGEDWVLDCADTNRGLLVMTTFLRSGLYLFPKQDAK